MEVIISHLIFYGMLAKSKLEPYFTIGNLVSIFNTTRLFHVFVIPFNTALRCKLGISHTRLRRSGDQINETRG